MKDLVLGKRYRGAVRMTENTDGSLRQVITIYRGNSAPTKRASYLTEHGKAEITRSSLLVKMRFPLPEITHDALTDLTACLSDEANFIAGMLESRDAVAQLEADRAKLSESIALEEESEAEA